ncbi:MAG: HAMP domain-containing histidine kinase [Candidatus Eisenbacteria bacterium]|uniref:histidine kinase n=1 Tax=Eiseniibacteriota bacterium TaxID=2212470 RepID=A0A538U3B6_UNCEI|nr:MAG: HAMP domain-containing histidine kinase [Candidatus Eisenbacteria bacterium]
MSPASRSLPPAERLPRDREARGILAALRSRRSEIGIGLILLGFIVLPSGILGLLSWRAVQRERSYSEVRLRESHRRYARLAAHEIDVELEGIESRWQAALDSAATPPSGPTATWLARHDGREPLIAGYYLIHEPGVIAYPPNATRGEARPAEAGGEVKRGDREVFERVVARGEDLEYHDHDLKRATETYRTLLVQVHSEQLRAIAQSYVGRAQLKDAEWTEALSTYRDLLLRYPEARDLHRMYLRFLAQYQIAVALEGMGREHDALEALAGLGRDLVRRSDAIQSLQYSYYMDLIETMAERVLSAPALADAARWRDQFRTLKEQGKKRISQRYFIQLLEAELDEIALHHRHWSPRLRYLSEHAEGEPFLLVYRPLPDAAGVYVKGVLAAQIDLGRLKGELLRGIIANLQPGGAAGLAIVSDQGESDGTNGNPRARVGEAALQTLAEPFDFWQVAVIPHDVPGTLKRLDLTTTLWLWLVSLLLLAILSGAVLFVRRARREAYLARAQTTFVSNVSHELRTPLASIRMFAELLEMQLEHPERAASEGGRRQAADHLEIIRRECDRLGRLIENVLDFSRLEHRTRRYRLEPRNPGELLERIVASFRPHAEAHGFRLALLVDEGLPAVLADEDAIAQVMLNLLGNAVQYSDAVREIQIHARREAGTVAIDVADRGIGIEPGELPRVFDKFYTGRRRMDSAQGSGLGLGLTLARAIARAHGGDIRVASVPGEGSTFTVTLPVPRLETRASGRRAVAGARIPVVGRGR